MEELLRQPGQGRHVLVAVSPDNTVLGLVMLTVESNPRRRHTGGLGIMVRTDCQGQGIGTALLEAVLDLADNWLMLHRVELEVYADNGDAIRLYQRFGFETEGRKREAAVKAGRKWCDFIAYDPRVQNPDLALKILRVERDEPFIDFCLKQLKKANKYKEEIKSKLLKMIA